MLIAVTAIVGMMLVIPDWSIPIITKSGKNSLLIYLAHRFFTILYYKELFPYHSFNNYYIIYAGMATIITCAVFGSNKLNEYVIQCFNKIGKSKNAIFYTMLMSILFSLIIKSIPMIVK